MNEYNAVKIGITIVLRPTDDPAAVVDAILRSDHRVVAWTQSAPIYFVDSEGNPPPPPPAQTSPS
jgi:hypothetical protein